MILKRVFVVILSCKKPFLSFENHFVLIHLLCRHIGLDTQWNVGIISGNRKHNSNVSRLNHFRITLRFTAVNRIAVMQLVKRKSTGGNTDRFYEVPSSTDSPNF